MKNNLVEFDEEIDGKSLRNRIYNRLNNFVKLFVSRLKVSRTDDKDLSVDLIKKQYEELKAKKEEFEKYEEELLKYDDELVDIDYCLIKSNDLNSVVNCKRESLARRFSQYKNIIFSSNSINTLIFMNKESITEISRVIEKLDKNELLIEKTYKANEFTIKQICKLYMSYEDKKYIIKGIESFDKKISGTVNEMSNKYEEYHLKNKEIRDKFIKAFSETKYELDIASPWLNNYVVNEELINSMESLLIKGASIKIIYGIENKIYNSEDIKNINSDKIVHKLQDRFNIYRDKFKIKKVNSHNKLLICDESYYIETSFNLLSFAGEYDKNSKDIRDEGATYSTNLEVIKDLRNRYFSF
jgi:hypothetical protein